jgi:hypothetical protein
MNVNPMETMFYGFGHAMGMDGNCVTNGHGETWPLEWSVRSSWSLFQIQSSLHKGDLCSWMLGIIKKDVIKNTTLLEGGTY